MRYRQNCVIVVPIYKEVPDELEQLSLRQLDNVINNDMDIIFVRPKNGINIQAYFDLITKTEVTSFAFDDEYFKSNESYSKLLLSYDFYKWFQRYNYMMIYQTDCWIFRNEINKFCDMGYDYIGAPIYSAGSHWPSFKIGSRPVVGNGGLSIRKISTMMKITNPEGNIYKTIYNKYKDEWDNVKYEDMFICDVIAHEIYLNIPDFRIAEQFAIDTLPLHINKLNPMGVHRVFALYQWWKNMIPELNDDNIQKMCSEAYENFKNMYK